LRKVASIGRWFYDPDQAEQPPTTKVKRMYQPTDQTIDVRKTWETKERGVEEIGRKVRWVEEWKAGIGTRQ